MMRWLGGVVLLVAPVMAPVMASAMDGPQGHASIGIARSALHGTMVAVDLAHGNLMDRGIAASVSAELRETGFGISADLGRAQMDTFALFGRAARPGYRISYDQISWDDDAYRISELGAEADLSFDMSPQLTLRAGLFARQTDLGALGAGASPHLIPDQGGAATLGAAFGLSYDARRDDRHGFKLAADIKIAGLGGDRNWTSAGITATALAPLGPRGRVRAQAMAGLLDSRDPGGAAIYERAVLSGDVLRGFATNGIGPRDTASGDRTALLGNRYLAALIEASYPVVDLAAGRIDLGVFWSSGSLWSLDRVTGGAGPIDDSRRMRASAGLSVLWRTRAGTIALHWANPYQREEEDITQSLMLTFQQSF